MAYPLPLCADERAFDALPFCELKSYHWEAVPPYRPPTWAKLAVVGDDLTARLLCFEAEPRVTYTRRDEPMYKDSCLEFFCAPLPGRDEYLNVECNASGAFLCEFGPDREGRRLVADLTGYSPRVTAFRDCVGGLCWGVTVRLSRRFIAKLYGVSEAEITFASVRANFYKCGDDCAVPHYLALNPVTTLPPGFHNPACFATFAK